MKSVKGLSDIQDFFNWMWAVDPRLASRLNDLHDYYRRACKQAASSATTYGEFSFTVDDRYRVDVRDQNNSLELGLFHINGLDSSVISWSSSEMVLVLEMTTHSVVVKGIKTAEDFIAEYQRLLVLYRAAFQKATAGE
ncbi:hypothetical protein AT328_002236 [Escherichia coli]|uniref:Uncharacterized protein n=2 Tax=Enterobacteriaceae TaxID=543 RepID=A0A377HC18_ECOLX|nr:MULTISPECIES: hypothetical protein [Enterobacteriaceae]EHD3441796.1 hypothetical protein [Escherichia coli O152]EIQ08892.1 hypothetical protein SF285071_2321 [Shigella flexneri 2850-71]EAB1026926.1 hypothetical protein [Shigella sonnei]EAB6513055.1 hypothetical protein [Shigella flexneri]EFK6714938.1 hypothetical protein [Escherichia coli]